MKKILVVAHDAGGAEVIASYIKRSGKRQKFECYIAGPATRIFRRERIPFAHAPEARSSLTKIMRTHDDFEHALIAAPGWMTKTEMNALESAKHAGLKTIVYMDSWGNERKRFGYPKAGWENRLPDEFWAADEYALKILKKEFRGVHVRLVSNHYYRALKERYQKHARRAPKPKGILFMSDVVKGSERVLNEFLSALSKSEEKNIRIRFHPADRRNRYDKIIKRYGSLHIKKSDQRDIVEDLVLVKTVVGLETAAMVAALAVGKKTICLAHLESEAFLPHKGFIRVSSPRDAVLLLPKG